MFLSSLYFALLAKLKIWQTTETYSPQTFSVTAAVVAPAVVICLNSLLIQSRVPRLLRFVAAIFPGQRATAKFVNEVQHLTRFIEEVDSELPSSLMMLIRQLLKMKNGCEPTKNRRNTNFQSLLQVKSSLMVTLNMESRKPMGRLYPENRFKNAKALRRLRVN